MRFLKLLLSGCFVYAALMAGASLTFFLRWPPWSAAVVAIVAGGGAALLIFYLSGGRRAVFGPTPSSEEVVEDLRAKGLLESTEYRVTRAFQVEELEDEGSHYFLELQGGAGVLYLSGQYLYEFEPIDDDEALNQPRRFPCTQFTVHRHKEERYVVDLACAGEVLQPETQLAPFSLQEHQLGLAPADGDVITDRSYETIKRQRGAKPH